MIKYAIRNTLQMYLDIYKTFYPSFSSPSFVTLIIRTVLSPFRNSIGVNRTYKLDARGDNYRLRNSKFNSLATYNSKLSLRHSS